MRVAINHQSMPIPVDHFLADDADCVSISPHVHPFHQVVARVNVLPFNRWVSEKNANLPITKQSRIDFANGPEERLIDWKIPFVFDLSRVLPYMPQIVVLDDLAADKSIHQVLIPRVAEFHNDVV